VVLFYVLLTRVAAWHLWGSFFMSLLPAWQRSTSYLKAPKAPRAGFYLLRFVFLFHIRHRKQVFKTHFPYKCQKFGSGVERPMTREMTLISLLVGWIACLTASTGINRRTRNGLMLQSEVWASLTGFHTLPSYAERAPVFASSHHRFDLDPSLLPSRVLF